MVLTKKKIGYLVFHCFDCFEIFAIVVSVSTPRRISSPNQNSSIFPMSWTLHHSQTEPVTSPSRNSVIISEISTGDK